MQKREAKFTLMFRHWLRAKSLSSGVFELKQSTSNAISFSAVQEHQIDFLMAAKGSSVGLVYKIPDDSRGVKPFDLCYFKNTPAWIVIRYPKSFHVIAIETFLLEKKRSKRKSLISSRAREISTYSVNL